MKALLALLSLVASTAFGTTLNPVQLLNPAGSTSGQAIVSTGASTAPGWGNVSATALAAQAANTVVANVTGSTASPTAVVVSNCVGTSSALNYTSGRIPLLNGVNTWSGAQTFSALITPSPTVGIKGTSGNDNAQAGSIGEYPTPTNLSAVSLTSGTATNVSSASLPGGDYDVECTANFVPAASTTWGNIQVGVSTTSATQPGLGGYQLIQAPLTAGLRQTIKSGAVRIQLASTTTVYCVATTVFGTSTMTADGFMRVRRVR
jgi:hypothetical protein